MNRKVYIVIVMLLFPAFLAAANPGKEPVKNIPLQPETPTQAIKALDAMAGQYRVGKRLTAADQAFNRQLKEKMLKGTFDLRELAKLALDKYWKERTSKEQDRFVDLLTNLIQERSVFSKEKASEKGDDQPYVIIYKGDRYTNPQKTDSFSKTAIRLKKRNMKVEIDYKLRKTLTGWKIYDVIMDDSSLVDNYRYSFGNIIKKQGYPELVRRMENKLQEFRSKNS